MAREAVRVVVHYREPTGPGGSVEHAYAAAGEQLAGTPGLVRHDLLRLMGERDRYALIMEWRDSGAFRAWEHRLRAGGHASPLRPFQDRERPGGHYEIYKVVRV